MKMVSLGSLSEETNQLKVRMLNLVSYVALGLMFPILVLTLYQSVTVGWDATSSLTIVFYFTLLLSVLLKNQVCYVTRVLVLTLVLSVDLALGVYQWSFWGTSFVTLMGLAVLITTFLSYRLGVMFIVVATVALVFAAHFYVSGQWTPSFDVVALSQSWLVWGHLILTIFVVTLLIIICNGILFENLENSIENTKHRELDLQAKNRILVQQTKELEAAKSDLEQASRSKDRFLQMVSHELRTPVNPILGLIQTVRAEESLSFDGKQNLSVIENSAEHLLRMIDQLLDLTSIEGGELVLYPEWVSLSKIYEELNLFFRYQAQEKGIEFHCSFDKLEEFSKGNREYYFDKRRLIQLLSELVSNAIKFTKDGSVTIQHSIQVSENLGEQRIQLCVIDTGVGMSKEQQENVFDVFTQVESSLNRAFGGLGVGLTVASKLARALNCKMDFHSEINQGTRVCLNVDLPCRKGVNSIEHVAKKQDKIFEPSIHILVAEDDVFNQRVVTRQLTKLGADYTIADNGLEAVDKCSSYQYDAILMDVSMPQMDGIEATRKIRQIKEYENIPIIALTAHNSIKTEISCRQAGMDDFLTKPAYGNRIYDAISSAIEKV